MYTEQQRKMQQAARRKHAPNITLYEQKPKPISDSASFVDLMFAGTSLHIPTFQKWLVSLEDECKKQGIKILSSSGAKAKKIQRAFYKAFFVYSVVHRDEGFKQMTDVLRCSIVFDNFDDLYRCYAVIEKLAKQDNNSGILRVKDRYNPIKMPFGYRDMLINIYCPGTKIVCEIQLHHTLFYKIKKVSHNMYKKARLFEHKDENHAYRYADEHIRKVIGTKLYQLKEDDLNAEEKETDNDASVMSYKALFESLNMVKFIAAFEDDGWIGDANNMVDVVNLLAIEDSDLKEMKMKKGHINRWKRKLEELQSKQKKLEEPLLSEAVLETHNEHNLEKEAGQINGPQDEKHKRSDTLTSDSSAYRAFMSVD